MLSAQSIIDRLSLQRHPEGGWYRETWRHDPGDGTRGAGTAIYFLLCAGEKSAWHRVDAAEIWHYYAGAPLLLRTSADLQSVADHTLGAALEDGQLPQCIVAPHQWQSAQSLGAWTLVGCTVSPAFEFAGFEMAKP